MLNISTLQNSNNVIDFLGAGNYLTGRLFIVLVFLAIMIFLFMISYRSNKDIWQSFSVSGFAGFILGLIVYTQKFNGISVVPEWFLWIVGVITAISITIMYVKGN